ncbi:ATP-binding cassette domain-containing protein [Telmatospirillum siberiense]|uniref:Aliphatic sulfonate ABC transporter ATP-binding protein n=1 Tax=Telmatospirillum siberiense TaxID=382514 RepID=A0A2N3PP14_9PROT|nr:ATP-binding cassette domain-containing protein [Telmatospirillum siberiense]PKU22140.1 aliphatic sulfonate ABC transporter ATP-binding protein [Telmatospirillum siberiense]
MSLPRREHQDRAADEDNRGVAISIDGLARSFGAQAVLEGIDLKIEAGSFVAVVGRSGCGKSTLLRLLVGLDQPTSGSVRFSDPVTGAAVAGAGRIMFQEARLLPWAKVLENVEVGLGRRRSLPTARAAASATLAAVGLEGRENDWPGVLSGGQRQRVALARSLVSAPDFLALDEPFGALDALTRIEMQTLLEGVWLDQGFTALFVTHDVAEALTLADRVILLEDGRVALDQVVDLPRPRRRGSVDLALLEEQILKAILGSERVRPEYEI